MKASQRDRNLMMGWRQDKVDRKRKQTKTKVKNYKGNLREYLYIKNCIN
jgi:hypothetical protein